MDGKAYIGCEPMLRYLCLSPKNAPKPITSDLLPPVLLTHRHSGQSIMVPIVKTNYCVVESEDALPGCIPQIVDMIHRNGYVIVDPWDNSERTIKVVGEYLGHIQRHILANEDGVVGENPVSSDWAAHSEEYVGFNGEEFHPHTDGSYLNGATLVDGTLYQVNPPRALLLQMAKPYSEGGANYVVDAQRFLMDLVEERPDMVKVLMENNCLTSCRDDLMNREFPVFGLQENNKIRLTFRFDSKVYASQKVLKVVRELNSDYFLNPKYQVHCPLAKGQILIVDNSRALHAREKCVATNTPTCQRKIRRVWLAEDVPRCLLNVHNRAKTNRVLKGFECYGIINSSVAYHQRGHLDCGISLSDGVYTKIASL